MLPRIWLVPYLRGWSYDLTARALVRHLSHRFEFRVAYQNDVDTGAIDKWNADLVVDLWWRGNLQRHYRERCITQISSHRWEQAKWGGLRPTEIMSRYASESVAVAVPSQRLLTLLANSTPESCRVHLAPKGFEPSLFHDAGLRRGPLTVGWAGASVSPDKHLSTITSACPDARLADQCLTQLEMGDFYNSTDVIACASEAEGDPRPLIEGMACGCFPVTTDVGIVPELVRHGVNGLVVERTAEAFAEAFTWCRANIDLVRAAGSLNAVAMLARRTWSHVAPAWGDVLDYALDRSAPIAPGPIGLRVAGSPARLLARRPI